MDDVVDASDRDRRLRDEGRCRCCAAQDLRDALVDDAALPGGDPDPLAGPFAHIVVDEAQELTDAEWQMLLRRCPSRSFTIVGDRAQARHGFAESWQERLAAGGARPGRRSRSLTVNYRTPGGGHGGGRAGDPGGAAGRERADVDPPQRDRRCGTAAVAERDAIVAEWLAAHAEGVACVIGDPAFAGDRARAIADARAAKGLEFDLVVLVDPERFGDGHRGRGRPLRRDDPGDAASS